MGARILSFVVAGVLVLLSGCFEHRYLDYASAEQVCVALSACVPNDPVFSISRCIQTRSYEDADAPYRCLLDAGSRCDDVRACVGVSVAPGPCEASTACEGDAITACATTRERETVSYRQDCAVPPMPVGVQGATTPDPATLHGTCGGAGLCTYGACSFDGYRCASPTRIEGCVSGELVYVADCAEGLTCSDETPLPRCASADLPCGIACERWGMHCTADGCASDATACAPGVPGTSRCEGAVLRYCGVDGQFHRYDCVEHGWSTCAPTGAWIGSSSEASCAD